MDDLRRVDINLIKVLEAVLAEQNLTRAGERLGMAQPAVSIRLARLREFYGDELLVRQGRSFELTPLAQRLLPLSRHALDEVARTLALMPSFDAATTTRTFFLSGSDDILSELVGPMLTLLRREAPGAKLVYDSLPIANGVDPADLLRRDLLIAAPDVGVPGRHRSLLLDSYVCIVSSDNPLLRDGCLELDDLARMRFAVNSLHGRYRTPLDEELRAAGIRATPGVAVRGFLQLPFVVAGTPLAAFVPERVARRFMKPLGLAVARTPLPAKTLVETVFWHPSRDHDPARIWLLDVLLRAAEVVDSDDEAPSYPVADPPEGDSSARASTASASTSRSHT